MRFKKFAIPGVVLVMATCAAQSALGWGCARSFSASNSWGGSISHTSGSYGGWGGAGHFGSTTVTGAGGNSFSASHAGVYGGGYHGSYSTSYSSGGSYGGGFGAGLVTGAVVGATVATLAKPAPTYVYTSPTYIAPVSGVYVPPAPVVIAPPPVYHGLPLGSTVSVLPTGFTSTTIDGIQYYYRDDTWYRPYFGSAGPYYLVVPTP
jgi:hypothetical protein